jgi:crossover junction endodeoxyribonuclease RuvC
LKVIGIDPGAGGALVLLENHLPIEWTLMPTMVVGSSTRINAAALANWIENCDTQMVCVERVSAMPGQGVSSMFNFGHNVGTVMGVLGALRLPYRLVAPQTWKKQANLLGTDKDAARSRAIELWPDWRDLDKKIAGQAFADAALIARFGS